MTWSLNPASRIVQDLLLDLFASCTQCAIGLYEESDTGGKDRWILPSEQLKSYCRKMQSFPSGERRCYEDHVGRAKKVLQSGNGALTLCHAGVFNQALPVKIDGKVRAVLMYGQMCVEGDPRLVEARKRHEDTIRELNPGEDDELELYVYFDQIKLLSAPELDLLNQQLSVLQRVVYEMLGERQELNRQTEAIIHDVQTRLQSSLALAENLSYDLKRMTTSHEPLFELHSQASELLQSLLALRVLTRNLGSFMPEYEFRTFSLSSLVEEACSLYSAEAERKKVEIRVRLDKPHNIEIYACPHAAGNQQSASQCHKILFPWWTRS